MKIVHLPNSLRVVSDKQITESTRSKLNAEINGDIIVSWLRDNHCDHLIVDDKSQLFCEKLTVESGFLSKFDNLHKDFLEFVDSLPEIDATELHTELEDSEAKEEYELVTSILTCLHNHSIKRAILMRDLEIIEVPMGFIPDELLIKMCECYLEKYGNKNGQSAESTAS